MLLGSGMYSTNQIFAQNENEAEIEADIEQENKCKKDTECENENEINNKLNITTITGAGAGNGDGNGNGAEPGTCAFCFTTTNVEPPGPWPPGQLTFLEDYLADPQNVVPVGNDEDVDSVEELCEALETSEPQVTPQAIADLIDDALPGNNDALIDDVITCLIDAGLLAVEP